jgi:CMP-N,N'-diacetyllegionaminic acid synthase
LPKILITLCARGGSKGIPGKNIKQLNGLPLIAYSIQMARRFSESYDCQIVLSTDSEEIKIVGKEFGLISDYQRPTEFATDQAGKLGVIQHVLEYYEEQQRIQFDFVLDLDLTSPMRTLEDLKNGFDIFSNNHEALSLFSVNTAARNPYFNMVEKKENGYFNLVSQGGDILSRQTAPKVYDMNASFYFYRRDFFDNKFKTAITPKSIIYEMPHECFDLDNPIDFEFLEFLLSNRKLSFEIWKS